MTAASASEAYFGTALRPRTFEQWVGELGRVLDAGRRRWLSGHHNLHSLYLRHHDASVAEFYRRCDDCYIDGVPVRWILAGFGIATTAAQRFSLMDHFPELLQHAQDKGWSLCYLGSAESVVNSARERIARQFPHLDIELHHGYFDDDSEIVRAINAQRPDLLFVGMGMPRQETWLLRHLETLDIGCATQAGATLDYFAGAQARPPRWLSRIGLAWLFRLAHEPGRLWRRYLLEPWGLLWPTLRCRFGRRGGPAG